MCGVYGPVEVRATKERCDQAVIEVVVKPETGIPGPRERQLEQLLAACCDQVVLVQRLPHTAFSIILQVETSQGDVSPSALGVWT